MTDIIKSRALKSLQFAALACALVTGSLAAAHPAMADGVEELNTDSDTALKNLIAHNPSAAEVASHARAVLIFPNIVKAGLIFGGAYGEGELKKGNTVDGYYNTLSASWGLQAGAQSYGYALFLMNDKAVAYLHKTHGLEIGTGPNVVIVNEGVAKNLSTSTLKDDVYAYVFDQQGLMAGVDIEGTKVSHIHNP